ncbi:transcription initiation factor IIB-like [Nematostella vectensis]|uniref:transcription initiation factor IIB-like n=1 Tax=Nematostella vectensis TaxID=45351 RepID=UPI002076E590|nr:transcription initiation factor IIB-like [Nematostella vectensis]
MEERTVERTVEDRSPPPYNIPGGPVPEIDVPTLMPEFALFDRALTEYETSRASLGDEDSSNTLCNHDDLVTEDGVTSCLECGEQMQRVIAHEREWGFYGHSDGERSSDPSRVQVRRSEDRNIDKDVEGMGFSGVIVAKANEIYTQVTKGQIFRGDPRKAIVFACVYYAYKMSGKCQTPKTLMETFGLSRKSCLKGLKIFSINAPKDYLLHGTSPTVVDHIRDVMDRFSASPTQKGEVVQLYYRSKNRSSELNRARPQSFAVALTYYWVRLKGVNITLKKFSERTGVSELTISRKAREVATVLGTPGVV